MYVLTGHLRRLRGISLLTPVFATTVSVHLSVCVRICEFANEVYKGRSLSAQFTLGGLECGSGRAFRVPGT